MKNSDATAVPLLHAKRICITGGRGFLGTHLIDRLRRAGYGDLLIADLPDYNLVDPKDVARLYNELRPDIVIHLAAKVGGIGYNQSNPATLFYDNLMMGVQLIHEGYIRSIEKFVAIGTICAYPKFTPVPFREEDLWNGYPEETNAPYGLAKKMMLVQSQAYRRQYGFNAIFLLPVNLYGPGDNFDFLSSHVIPALIRKFCLARFLDDENFDAIRADFLRFGNGEAAVCGRTLRVAADADPAVIVTVLGACGVHAPAPMARSLHKELRSLFPLSGHSMYGSDARFPGAALPKGLGDSTTVEVWGTGAATREFFYVEDAAEAIMAAMERYNESEPVNIGAGFEISIADLVQLIAKLAGFGGDIYWNNERPDGQPRRMLDTDRAADKFGFRATTGFREGLKKTIDWYLGEVARCNCAS